MTARREVVGLFLLFTLLGLVYTYPLVRHFSTGIPYTRFPAAGAEVKGMEPGDHLQLYYWFWLMQDNLTGGSPLFTNPYEFDVTPVLPAQRYGFYQFPLSLLFVVFSPLGGAFAYNSMVILSFGLAGWAMYLLVRLYTPRRGAALVAALIFALAPFRLAQLLGGHSNGFLFFLFPLTLYAYERGLRGGGMAFGVAAGLCLVSLALTDFHLLYYLLLFSAGYWIVRGLEALDLPWGRGLPELAGVARQRGGEVRRLLRVGLPVLVATGVTVGYVLFMRTTVMGGSFTAGGGRPYALIARNAPSLANLLERAGGDDERAIYLGIVPALLGIVGLTRWRGGERATRLIYGAGFLLALWLSLGPTLDPWLPLYRALYAYLPYFNYPRSPARLMVLTFMTLGVLAGFALAALPRGKPWARIAVVLVGLAIGLEYAPFRAVGITRLDPMNPLYQTVGREAGDARFLAVPLFPGDSHQSSVYEFYVTTTRARMVNGYNPLVSRAYVEGIFDRLVSLNLGEMRKPEYELLRALRVKFLLVHEELFFWKVSPFPGALTVTNLRASPYVRVRGRAGDLTLLELLPEPGGPPQRFDRSSPVAAVHEVEELARRTGREAVDGEASSGRAVTAEEGRDGPGYLAFGVAPFYPTGRYVAAFRLRLDGVPPPGGVALVDVSTERGRRVLATRELTGADFGRPGEYRDFELPWALEAPGRVEFRVLYRGRGQLWADRVHVAFADRSAPAPVYEAEELLRQIGEIRIDPDASGGTAVYAAAGRPQAYAAFGPYRRYPPGRYEALFRLKLDPGASEAVAAAVIDVSADRGRRELAVRAVTGGDLAAPGRYHDLRVPFTVERPAVLEFRVLHRGRAGLWFDRVAVRATAGQPAGERR